MPFFAVRELTDSASLFMGGSNTVGISTPDGFRQYVTTWLLGNRSDVTTTIAVGGTNSWYSLVRMAEVIAANPTHIFIECATNDEMYFGVLNTLTDRANGWKTASEALIVKLRTVLPNAKLIHVSLQGVNEWINSTSEEARDAWAVICAHHEIPNHRFDLWLTALLGHTPTEVEHNTYHDGAHFFQIGHQEIYNMVVGSLPGYYTGSSGWSGNLSDYQPYVYDDVADWVGEAINRTGVDNDGETGAGWSTNGTIRLSSTAGDTISWTGTITSFGLLLPKENFTFGWSLDGGGFINVDQQTDSPVVRQLWAPVRGAHTVTIKVVSGTVKIDRFLAL